MRLFPTIPDAKETPASERGKGSAQNETRWGCEPEGVTLLGNILAGAPTSSACEPSPSPTEWPGASLADSGKSPTSLASTLHRHCPRKAAQRPGCAFLLNPIGKTLHSFSRVRIPEAGAKQDIFLVLSPNFRRKKPDTSVQNSYMVEK